MLCLYTVQIVGGKGKINKHKYGLYLQWCLFFIGWPFLVGQVTNLAAVMAHCGISPSRYGSLSKLGLFSNSLWICVIWGIYVSLIWSYIWQEVRKCSSVSTSFCGQCAHSLSSLESQVCLWQPFSIARLCSLSLCIVKSFLKFGSVTVVRYSATVYSLFRASLSLSLSLSNKGATTQTGRKWELERESICSQISWFGCVLLCCCPGALWGVFVFVNTAQGLFSRFISL